MPEGAEEGIKCTYSKKMKKQLFSYLVQASWSDQSCENLTWWIPNPVWSVTSFNELSRDGMACETAYTHLLKKWKNLGYLSRYRRYCSFCYRPYACVQRRAYLPDGRPFVALGTDGYQIRVRTYVVSLVLMLHICYFEKISWRRWSRCTFSEISNFELDTDRPVAWAPQAKFSQLLNTMKRKQVRGTKIKTPDIGVDKAVVAEILLVTALLKMTVLFCLSLINWSA